MVVFSEDKQTRKLDELRAKEAEELAQILSGKYGLDYIDLSRLPINTDALRLIPEAEARAANLAAFKLSGRHLHLALLSPDNLAAKNLIEELKNKNYLPQLYLASAQSVARAWGRYAEISHASRAEAGVIDISAEDLKRYLTALVNLPTLQQAIVEERHNALTEGGISNLLEIILAGALKLLASDIHVEPEEKLVRLRYRLDGVLHDLAQLETKLYTQLLARIKLISGLKLNIRSAAQDGRFSLRLDSGEIEVRTAILPGAYGESIVLRLLNPETLSVPFDKLGLEPALAQLIAQEIAKPNGLILLTGPTGSGKTTTLYTFLKRLNTPETKIITIEDPIEYHLPGVSQTQVAPEKDYTFLSGLRSALRQDPDIIMVGEIRDEETAHIAINAALTGHLVFSTLHTNSAWGAIPRLIDLQVNAKTLESALTIAIAQRLVRVLCSACRQTRAPRPEESELINRLLTAIKKIRPDLTWPPFTNLWTAVGCTECNNTGFRGRMGIFEALIMDPAVGLAELKNPSERELRLASRPQGILDMREDGILKVLRGLTTLDELGRVVDLTAEILTESG